MSINKIGNDSKKNKELSQILSGRLTRNCVSSFFALSTLFSVNAALAQTNSTVIAPEEVVSPDSPVPSTPVISEEVQKLLDQQSQDAGLTEPKIVTPEGEGEIESEPAPISLFEIEEVENTPASLSENANELGATPNASTAQNGDAGTAIG
ncbi:MAG: hypothetical protein R3261_09195, partial [Alphaproteobacteria bacterium]|nr:hypothetical protein [Alphaproteobacteria bacterium]